MSDIKSYTVLSSAVEHRLLEKNSEFITFLQPVSDSEQALHWLQHYHECYKVK